MKIKGIDNGNQLFSTEFEAESRASGTPWINLTLNQAKTICESLGPGYSLISNQQWMAIAYNIESVVSNWSDHQVHPTGQSDAMLNVGHSCRKGNRGIGCRWDVGNNIAYEGEGCLPADSLDENGCYGLEKQDWEENAPELNENGWSLYRRTFYLTTGEVIWDFSGNVWEWVDFYIELADERARIDEKIDDNYLEINACEPLSTKMQKSLYQSINPQITEIEKYCGENYFPDGDDRYGFKVDHHTNLNRLGRYHPTSRNYDAGAVMRGGSCMHGDCNNGIYAIGMGYGTDPDEIKCKVGFRCVWQPGENHNERGKSHKKGKQ